MKRFDIIFPEELMAEVDKIAKLAYSNRSALIRKLVSENLKSISTSENEKEAGIEIKKEDKPTTESFKLPEAFKLQLLRRLEQLPDTFVFSFDGQDEKFSKLRLLEAVQNDTELGMKLFNYFEESAS
jgi:Arc/MetJ-type ribon-helix-helix transcriptional regulator